VALEIAGVVEPGLVLHGGYMRDYPDRHVTFELRIGRKPGRSCVPLMRIDWRSLHGGHSNNRRWSVQCQPRVSNTHYHTFDLNWDQKTARMRQGLPLACEINESLPTFDALRRFVGNAFRINNIVLVQVPNWQYNLLVKPGGDRQ
jgi:hypothetical protein